MKQQAEKLDKRSAQITLVSVADPAPIYLCYPRQSSAQICSRDQCYLGMRVVGHSQREGRALEQNKKTRGPFSASMLCFLFRFFFFFARDCKVSTPKHSNLGSFLVLVL